MKEGKWLMLMLICLYACPPRIIRHSSHYCVVFAMANEANVQSYQSNLTAKPACIHSILFKEKGSCFN